MSITWFIFDSCQISWIYVILIEFPHSETKEDFKPLKYNSIKIFNRNQDFLVVLCLSMLKNMKVYQLYLQPKQTKFSAKFIK